MFLVKRVRVILKYTHIYIYILYGDITLGAREGGGEIPYHRRRPVINAIAVVVLLLVVTAVVDCTRFNAVVVSNEPIPIGGKRVEEKVRKKEKEKRERERKARQHRHTRGNTIASTTAIVSAQSVHTMDA